MARDMIAATALLLHFFCVASPGLAEQRPVSIRILPSSNSLPCKSGTLSISTSDPTQADKGTQVFRDLAIPATIEARMEPGAWKFSFATDNCWAQDVLTTVTSNQRSGVEVVVWPQIVLKGTLRVAAPVEAPERVTVAFAPSFKEARKRGPEGKVVCPVGSNLVFLCRIPGARLDLRVSTPGFVPVYDWNVKPPPGGVRNLGSVLLTPGASVSGWLVTEENGELSPEDIRVTLMPAGIAEATNLGEERLKKAMTSEALVEKNGFFQFTSLEPGDYVLRVSSTHYAEATIQVRVVEDRTSELRHPVVLQAPMKADFVVDPAVDYYQRSWHIEILRVDRYKSHYAKVAEGEVPSTGWYETTGVNPTLHMVRVTDSKGQEVLAKTYDLSETPMPVVLEIGMVPVQGVVMLGDEPLEARVWFGGKHGAERIETASGEEGRFEAILPRSGRWRVELESEEPPVRRKLQNIEVDEWDGAEPVVVNLELPNTKIEGTVRREDGSPPETTTIVYAAKGTWDRHVSVRADSEGRFEFLGLEEGVHEIHALTDDSRSETAAVGLQADEERRIDLILRRRQTVAGRVRGDDGSPVPGAFVVVQPANAPSSPAPQVGTDGDGWFEAQVPADTQEVNITVGSPGRTMGVYRLDVRSTEEALVTLPQQGGNLEIRLPRNGVSEIPDHTLVVFRDGLPFSEGSIWWWSQINKDESQGPSESTVQVPSLMPGFYEVCFVPYSSYPRWLLGYREQHLCGSGAVNQLGLTRVDLSKVPLTKDHG